VSVAGEYDVDARLAQGGPVVDDIGEYVRACQQLGYHHPDLTADPAQVRDWYTGEAGLRLDALGRDAAALTAVATAADDAVRRQDELLATLSGAWAGQGAGVALDFLDRHQRAAATVSAAVREAADACTALREELWRAVDAKVAATLAVDTSHRGQRAAWLAAARTVSTGAGDRATASELVDQQVKPFVDNGIGIEWVGAMRAAGTGVDAAYDDAIARVRAAPDAVFEVPGGLGPQWTAPVGQDTQGDGGGAEVRPAGFAAPDPLPSSGGGPAGSPPAVAPTFATPPAPSVAPAAPPLPAAAEAPLAAPAAPSLPSSPLGDLGGMPSMGTGSSGSGLAGFGQQLADLIGGLTGSADDAGPESDQPGLADDQPFDVAESDKADDPDDSDPDGDEKEAPDTEPEPTDPADTASTDPTAPEDPAAAEPEVTSEPPPASTPVPPPVPEPPPAQDVAAVPPAPTPCEIAADELPQVGE